MSSFAYRIDKDDPRYQLDPEVLARLKNPNGGPVPDGGASLVPPADVPQALSPETLERVRQADPMKLAPETQQRLQQPSAQVLQFPTPDTSQMQLRPQVSAQPRLLSGSAPAPDTSGATLNGIDTSKLVPPNTLSQDAKNRIAASAPPAAPVQKGTLPGDLSERLRLLTDGSPVDSIAKRIEGTGFGQNHPTGGKILGNTLQTLAKIGDVAGSIIAPNVMTLAPGTTLHHQQLLQRNQAAIGQDFTNAEMPYKLAQDQADTTEKQAKASQEAARAYALTHPKPTDGQILFDKDGGPIGFHAADGSFMGADDPRLPAGVNDILHAAQRKRPTNAFELWQQQNPNGTLEQYNTANSKPLTAAQAQALNAVWDSVAQRHHLPKGQFTAGMATADATQLQTALNNAIAKQQGDTRISVSGPKEPKQLVYVPQPDGSERAVEVTPGTVIPHNASRQPGGPKISADEGRRADLGANLQENIDGIEEILNRRPDLFGPMAGRWTNVKNFLGSDDPDVTSLVALQHQVGMATMGAHSMRSAPGLVTAMNSLVNSFHNSPQATKAALERARSSVQTFLHDSQNPGQPRYGAPARFATTATGADGHKIGTNDGVTWFDVQTGKQVQ